MTDQITRLLDTIQKLDREATKGPWKLNQIMGGDYLVHGDEDIAEAWGTGQAEFIALSRTALPKLAEAVRAVLELHKPFAWSFSAGDSVYTITSCEECARLGAQEEDNIYPCQTVQAITDVLEGSISV